MSFEGGFACLRQRFTRWKKFAIGLSSLQAGERSLFVWGKELTKIGITPPPSSTAVALNSKDLAIATDNDILVFNTETGKEKKPIELGMLKIKNLVVIDDFIFFISQDSLHRYSLSSKELEAKEESLSAIGKNRGGLIVATREDLRLINPITLDVISTYPISVGKIQGLVSLESGKVVVDNGLGKQLYIVDILERTKKRVNLLHPPLKVDTAGDRILITYGDGALELLNFFGRTLSTAKPERSGTGLLIDETTVFFLESAKRIVFGEFGSCSAQVWDFNGKRGKLICDTSLGMNSYPLFVVRMPLGSSETRERKETDKLFVSFLVANSPVAKDIAWVIAQFI